MLWLPHLRNVTESIQLNKESIDACFIVHEVDDPMRNPLFAATEQATDELKRCPDLYLNENQLPPLLVESRFPFYALRLKRALLEEDHQCDEEDDDEAIDTLRMWDAISATPDISSTTIFVRVFIGADGSHQKGPFLIALQAFQRSLTTISGKVKIKIDAGTQSGKVLRLKGKGLPSVQGYATGDLFVHINVYTPTKISKEETELARTNTYLNPWRTIVTRSCPGRHWPCKACLGYYGSTFHETE
jgi:hypothetical protein